MKKTLVLMVIACVAQAQAIYEIDPSQSRATFTLGDVLHTVHGVFKVKNGSIRFDPSTGIASGEVVVDAASGESGSGARDKRMHQNILESKQFPEIRFAPAQIKGTVNSSGESRVAIDGTFSIHGAQHPLTATALVTASGDRLQTKVHFVVPYVVWGMKNPSTLFLRVAETVEIDLDAAGHIAWR